MLSIAIFATLWFASQLALAGSIAAAARAVGSKRGRFLVGLALVIALACVDLLLATITGVAMPGKISPLTTGVIGVALTGVQLVIAGLVFKRTFDLRGARALAPPGAYIGTTVSLILLAVFVIRPYVFEAFLMPTLSMSPTINPGDRIAVNKLHAPRRFDIVAYRVAGPRGTTDIFVKRLIGLPGERLRFEGTELFVNDQRLALPAPLAGRVRVTTPHTFGPYRDGQTIALAADEIFVIGDDADVSADSRINGPSKRNDVIGIADLRYWPLSRFGLLRP